MFSPGCLLAPPSSLSLSAAVGGGAKKRLVAPSLSLTLSHPDSQDTNNDSFSAAALSGTPEETPSLDLNLEALDTPSDSETGTLPDGLHDLEWEGSTSEGCVNVCLNNRVLQLNLNFDLSLTDDLPQMGKNKTSSAAEHSEGLMELDQVDSKGRRWRRFCISGQEYRVNMSVLEPYLQVLSHGG